MERIGVMGKGWSDEKGGSDWKGLESLEKGGMIGMGLSDWKGIIC